MTREEKYQISGAKIVVGRLDPILESPDDVKYLEDLYDALLKFFKSRFVNSDQFDVWRQRYVD